MVSAEVFFPGLPAANTLTLKANSSPAGQLFIALMDNNIHMLIASGMRPQIQQTKSELAAHGPMEVESLHSHNQPGSRVESTMEAQT